MKKNNHNKSGADSFDNESNNSSTADAITRHMCYAADCGFDVFPVIISHGDTKPEKTPLVKWKDEATRDPQKIETWKGAFPNCNGYGIKEGNGNFTLDFDNLSYTQFKEYFDALNKIVPLGNTFRQRTISERGYQIKLRCNPNDTPYSFVTKWGEVKAGKDERVTLTIGPGSRLGNAKYEPIDGTSLQYIKKLSSEEVKALVEWCGGNGDGSKPEFNIGDKLTNEGQIPVGHRHPTYLSTAGLLKQKGYSPQIIRDVLVVLNQHSELPKDVTELDDIVTYTMDFDHPNPIKKNQDIADVMQKRYYKELRFCHDDNRWKIYNGFTWQDDNRHKIVTYVEDTLNLAINWMSEKLHELKDVPLRKLEDRDFEGLSDDGKRELKRKWKLKQRFHAARERLDGIQSKSAHDNIGMYVKARLPITRDEFDRDRWLFNAKNGTIDLRTGQLLQHHYEDYISKISLIDYDPNARSDEWEAYLKKVLPSEKLRKFLQRAVGYSLTGSTQEEAVFFCYGDPATGKSTGIEAILKMMGDYGLVSNFGVFTKHYESNGPTEYIARFDGVRFVEANEVNENVEINSALLKSLVSGDKKNARVPYASKSIDFYPILKAWLIGNYRPKIKFDDEGVWRRFYVIPFDVVIPAPDRDKELKDRFKDDPTIQQAILSWAVEGCLEWQKEGVNPPDEVVAANIKYRAAMNPLYSWFDEKCIADVEAITPTDELYTSYKLWRTATGEREPLTKKSFGKQFSKFGFKSDRDSATKLRGWKGVRLRLLDDEEDEDDTQDEPFGRLKSTLGNFLEGGVNSKETQDPSLSGTTQEKVSESKCPNGQTARNAKEHFHVLAVDAVNEFSEASSVASLKHVVCKKLHRLFYKKYTIDDVTAWFGRLFENDPIFKDMCLNKCGGRL